MRNPIASLAVVTACGLGVLMAQEAQPNTLGERNRMDSTLT